MQPVADTGSLQSFGFVTMAVDYCLKKVMLDEAGISLWQRHETVQTSLRQPTNLVFVYNDNRNLYLDCRNININKH